jgi:hypothetical protein
MGVIVENTGMKKSANNKEYLVWHLSDLQVYFKTTSIH